MEPEAKNEAGALEPPQEVTDKMLKICSMEPEAENEAGALELPQEVTDQVSIWNIKIVKTTGNAEQVMMSADFREPAKQHQNIAVGAKMDSEYNVMRCINGILGGITVCSIGLISGGIIVSSAVCDLTKVCLAWLCLPFKMAVTRLKND